MRYERDLFEKRLEQIMDATISLVDSEQAPKIANAQKYHKSNWKVNPSKTWETIQNEKRN